MTARILPILFSFFILLGMAATLPAQTDSTKPAATAAVTNSPDSTVYPPSPERLAELISYSRFVNVWRFAEFFISVAVLLIILFSGLSAKLRDLVSGVRKNFPRLWLYFAFFLIVLYVLDFPANLYRNFVVENQYGFLNQTFMQWWGEDLLNLLLSAVIGIIPVWFLYWVISRFKRWWLVFSIGAIPFMVFFIVIAPVVISPLFNKYEPLKDKALETRILALADKAGIPGSHVFEVNASKQSSKINAYVTGLFNTKRIVLYDTLIKGFTPDEIAFVMGHEMGHYVMHHIWIGLLGVVISILIALWVIDRFVGRFIDRYRRRLGFERVQDIASLPLLLLLLTVFMFVYQPVFNGLSRTMEHSADKFGMDVSGVSGETAATAFDKMSVYNLMDPDPSALVEFWFYDHPAIKKRIAFVREYRP